MPVLLALDVVTAVYFQRYVLSLMLFVLVGRCFGNIAKFFIIFLHI